MCWDFGEGGWRSAFGGIGSLNLDEAKLDALLTVGKPSRLAPSGAAVEEVRRGALLTVGRPGLLQRSAGAEEVRRDALLTVGKPSRLALGGRRS
jgi:hypothetical protein